MPVRDFGLAHSWAIYFRPATAWPRRIGVDSGSASGSGYDAEIKESMRRTMGVAIAAVRNARRVDSMDLGTADTVVRYRFNAPSEFHVVI